jgi:hypothetical protein
MVILVTHILFSKSNIDSDIDDGYISDRYITDGYINDGYTPLSEVQLKQDYPQAYKYLLGMKDVLASRNMEKDTDWFLFARSQGIANMGHKKVVFKHIIGKDTAVVVPYVFDDDVVVYSGMYISVDVKRCVNVVGDKTISTDEEKTNTSELLAYNQAKYDYELSKIVRAMATPDFARYCVLVGKDMSGGYVSVNTKVVKAFGLVE